MRVIETFKKEFNSWVATDFENLEFADVFRLFDNGNRYIDGNGNNVWIADSIPYRNKDGQLTIDTLY